MTCPKQFPNQPETKTKEPTNATKGTPIAIVHVPNEALKKKGCYLDTKSPAANKCRNTKTPAGKTLGFFTQKKQREAQKEEERLSKECSRKKCKKKQQCAIYRGTGPRKAKRPNKLSLKRNVAWEYPESAARHKGLFWLPHPHSPRGPVRRRDLFNFQKPVIFLGKIGKLKRGAM